MYLMVQIRQIIERVLHINFVENSMFKYSKSDIFVRVIFINLISKKLKLEFSKSLEIFKILIIYEFTKH